MTKDEQLFSANSLTLEALAAAIQARIPVMLVGPPGVGKTATIRELAKSMGYDLITLLGSQMDPTDVAGLPKGEIIAHDEDDNPIWGTVYLAPKWQADILLKKKVILFLDEFSNTSAAVRASLLTLLQNREFPNGAQMPEETVVIGAMNPTEQAADGWELDKPTTNRMLFLTWKSSRDEWCAGMLDAWGQRDTISEEEKYWRNLVVSFINDNPGYLHRENNATTDTPEAYNVSTNDPSELEVLRYAWASRRSWDNLTRILAQTPREATALQDEIAAGLVGRSSATMLRQWILENSSIDPEKVLNNPKGIDWQNVEVSEANIVFRALVEKVDEKNWRKILDVMDAVADAKAEALIVSYLTDLLRPVVLSARKEGPEAFEEARVRGKSVAARFGKSAT